MAEVVVTEENLTIDENLPYSYDDFMSENAAAIEAGEIVPILTHLNHADGAQLIAYYSGGMFYQGGDQEWQRLEVGKVLTI